MKKFHLPLVQWHITARCQNSCRHCYMFDPKTYMQEKENEMTLSGFLDILRSIDEFERKWDSHVVSFVISGGDPLLHPDFFKLLNEIRLRNKSIYLMGNPETLTGKNISLIKEKGIKSIQMSLDGLEETHDHFRSKGSFRRTVKAINEIKGSGLNVNISFTLFSENKDQLLPLVKFLSEETPADGFGFELGSCSGNAASMKGKIAKNEIKELFASYLQFKHHLVNINHHMKLGEESNLLRLIRYEKSTFFPIEAPKLPVISGCSAGWLFVPILSDGTVLCCRRLPLKAGKMPEQSFEEIFLGSHELRRLRRYQFYLGCGGCEFYKYCRGCPAYASGVSGDHFAPNPLCFKDMLSKKPQAQKVKQHLMPVDTTYEEELELLSGHFTNIYLRKYDELIKDINIQRLLFILTEGGAVEKSLFLFEPDDYLTREGIDLSNLEKLFVLKYLEVI